MPAFPSHPADRRFYATMSVVAPAVIVTGFANTYGPKVISGSAPVPAIIHVHAALFACWLVLFVAQTLLVVRGHVLAHMRLGNAGLVLAELMLATGLAAAIDSGRAGHKGIPGVEFPTREGFLLLNVASVCVFTAQVAAGWRWRRRPQAHKRLMLATTVAGLMPPGISRLPGSPATTGRSQGSRSRSSSSGPSTTSRPGEDPPRLLRAPARHPDRPSGRAPVLGDGGVARRRCVDGTVSLKRERWNAVFPG